MAEILSASVGKHGRNATPDVIKVQTLLKQQGMPVGRVDGFCGPQTIAAIVTFQAGFLRHPDGIVDPNGKTWQRLNMISSRPNTSHAIAPKQTPSSKINSRVPAEGGTSITRLIKVSDLGQLNKGLKAVNNQYMTEKLGKPRESFTADCQPVTNKTLAKNIKTASVGPFRVTGLSPAVDSLSDIMAEISRTQPEIYTALGTAGMLCCRYVRGSTSSISNHSWGTAIDLTLNGLLDKRGGGYTQYGLSVIAPIFNNHGWYWGAAFATEDSMHFEVSRGLLDQFTSSLIK